jgi:RNA polymerase sigma factor (sigma-70 family)
MGTSTGTPLARPRPVRAARRYYRGPRTSVRYRGGRPAGRGACVQDSNPAATSARDGNAVDAASSDGAADDIVSMIPILERVVGARVRDRQLVDDLVQETVTRVMAASSRIDHEALIPYAIVTARNLVSAVGKSQNIAQRNAHLLLDTTTDPGPDEPLLQREERSMVGAALARLSPAEREVLLAHEVAGTGTAELAARRNTSPGAIAAQLNRTRAKLRVEYLLAAGAVTVPTDQCRPVLFALSAGDRRRQRELDTAGHLLSCDVCLDLSIQLFERRPPSAPDEEATIMVTRDADVVTARQQGRTIAAKAGFGATELTVIATAISEVARNIVKFARRGQIVVRYLNESGRQGVSIVARDSGPGIPDLSEALRDGYSTYQGLGLGLPGARRLMDEFDIVTEVGKGTTVSMTKWR